MGIGCCILFVTSRFQSFKPTPSPDQATRRPRSSSKAARCCVPFSSSLRVSEIEGSFSSTLLLLLLWGSIECSALLTCCGALEVWNVLSCLQFIVGFSFSFFQFDVRN